MVNFDIEALTQKVHYLTTEVKQTSLRCSEQEAMLSNFAEQVSRLTQIAATQTNQIDRLMNIIITLEEQVKSALNNDSVH